MVSSKLMREMKELFDAVAHSSIELGNYTGLLFDVAFEITTAETFIGGVASKIIDRDRITKRDKLVVQQPLVLEERWWRCDDGNVFDLRVNPEINSRALTIEKLRVTCVKALKVKDAE